MRLLYLALLGLLAFGCVQGGGGTNDGQNLSEAQLRPFLDAGCVNSDGHLDCRNASFQSTFGCLIFPTIAHNGAGLNPPLALSKCWAEVQDRSEARKEYFFCSGGMLNACLSYIVWENSHFVQLKNASDLAARVAPIESEQEALNYVLLSKDVSDRVERPIVGALRAGAERNTDGFLVTAYYHNTFGCYSQIDYEEVKYQVSANGSIEEVSRAVVYTEYLGYAICVD